MHDGRWGREGAAVHLGLIVDLSLRNYGMCVAERMKANPGVVKRVVLLVTPYKLGYDGLRPSGR